LEQARAILQELRPTGMGSVLEGPLIQVAQRLGDLSAGSSSWMATKEECQAAFDGLSDEERNALVSIHARVSAFAKAQRNSVQDMEMDIPGGKAGHTVSPCQGSYNIYFILMKIWCHHDFYQLVHFLFLVQSCRLLCSGWTLSATIVCGHDRRDSSCCWM
jgi:hypothetical protein